MSTPLKVLLAVELCDAYTSARCSFWWLEELFKEARRLLQEAPSSDADHRTARAMLDIGKHLAIKFANEADEELADAKKTLADLKARAGFAAMARHRVRRRLPRRGLKAKTGGGA